MLITLTLLITNILSQMIADIIMYIEPIANQSLTPMRPIDGCPKGTIDGISTCFCEDHCSWKICRLNDPPIGCPRVISWQWNPTGIHWVAQGKNLSMMP